jgi:hypothetical protein
MMIDLDDGFIDMLGTTKIKNEDGSYVYVPEISEEHESA